MRETYNRMKEGVLLSFVNSLRKERYRIIKSKNRWRDGEMEREKKRERRHMIG